MATPRCAANARLLWLCLGLQVCATSALTTAHESQVSLRSAKGERSWHLGLLSATNSVDTASDQSHEASAVRSAVSSSRASVTATVSSALRAAVLELQEAAADTEVGPDTALVSALITRNGGPSTLEDFCGHGHLAAAAGTEVSDSDNDPACELSGMVALLRTEVSDVHSRIGEWTAGWVVSIDLLTMNVTRTQVGVQEIEQAAKDITRLREMTVQKRDRLSLEGKLDGRLAMRLNTVIAGQERLTGEIGGFVQLREAGREHREARAMRSKMLRAAEGLQQSLRDLSGGLRPHGDRWAKYCHERASVEATLAVLVSFIMLFWERVFHLARTRFCDMSGTQPFDSLTQGATFGAWREHLATELTVCLLTFLSCWGLAQVHAFRHLWLLLGRPAWAHEHRGVVMDICVVFSAAVMIYYALGLAVVRATTEKLRQWAELERADAAATTGVQGPPAEELSTGESSQEALKRYRNLKRRFVEKVQVDGEVLDAVRGCPEDGFNARTPAFWAYAALSVRGKVDKLFQFGAAVWGITAFTFVLLALLHRFANLAYARVVVVLALLLCTVLAFTVRWLSQISGLVEAPGSARAESATAARLKAAARGLALLLLHSAGLLLCYGCARMLCQRWMWEMHFRLAMCVMGCFGVGAALFALKVAPMIPAFALATSLPPYLDADEAQGVLVAVRHAALCGSGPAPSRAESAVVPPQGQ